jgi:hypothetical protein
MFLNPKSLHTSSASDYSVKPGVVGNFKTEFLKNNKKQNIMNKIIIYGFLTLIGLFMISCSTSGNEDPIGKWDDNIKLSQKTATLNSNENSITITTESTSWWLSGISLNNNSIDLTNVNKLSKNFVITNSDFQVERKEDGKKIIITLNQNTTNSERILVVSMQNGDYFDGVKIIQTK